MASRLPLKPLKRADLVAQEVKRLITEKNLSPGDRLPRESELQAQFQVSKGTIREALKSLEVQGLVSISTGPSGGGTILQVPLDRTLQFMQNYLFFQEVTIDDIYAVRLKLEPELAAGAVEYLNEEDFQSLEHSISCCDPSHGHADLLEQRREDVNFHDILAAANPNPFLRFTCELINEMIRQLIVFGNRTAQAEHRRFGAENVNFHRQILDAARARDATRVRQLMAEHMSSASSSVQRMKGRLQGRLILDADSLRSMRPEPVLKAMRTASKSTQSADVKAPRSQVVAVKKSNTTDAKSPVRTKSVGQGKAPRSAQNVEISQASKTPAKRNAVVRKSAASTSISKK